MTLFLLACDTTRKWIERAMPWRKAGLCLALVATLSAATAVAAAVAESLTRSGNVTIEQVQIAFIGSGNLGGGKLFYGGQQYNFTIGGLGVGGIGISKMTATGDVYNLSKLTDFSGAYFQARYGLAVGQLSAGELWLKNASGVELHLKAQRTGLALSLGGDAIYIDFD